MAFIGEVRAFPYKFLPEAGGKWFPCDGRRLSIPEYQVLYTVIGDLYGSDGINYFQIPDVQGQIIAGAGDGPELTPRQLAAQWGDNAVALLPENLPPHRHDHVAELSTKTIDLTDAPAATYAVSRTVNQYNYAKSRLVNPVMMHPDVIGPAGQGKAHENRQPILSITYFICVSDGDYPVPAD